MGYVEEADKVRRTIEKGEAKLGNDSAP